jgi:hypothetical protein
MKTLKLLLVGILFMTSIFSQAQISVNVNIGTPPSWGPAGYSNIEYYYLPDVQAYYDIRNSQFIYFGGGQWVRSGYLPRQYRNYDLYHGYKVVLNDYHGSRPYTNYNSHKVIYYKGYRGKPQKNIGSNHYDKHEQSNNGHENNGHENNDHGNNEKGHGNGKH